MRLTSNEAIALIERFTRFVQQHVEQDVLTYESPDRFSLEFLGAKERPAPPDRGTRGIPIPAYSPPPPPRITPDHGTGMRIT